LRRLADAHSTKRAIMQMFFRVWYTIVYHTKHSPAFMAGFSGFCLAVPYGIYRLSENATNPAVTAERAEELRKKYNESLTQKMVREANKDRLEQLLKEVQQRSDDDRYVAALE